MSELSREQFESHIVLAERYLLGELDAQAVAAFEQRLLDDPQAALALLDFVRQAGVMRVLFSEQQRFADRVGESSYGEYVAMLESLLPSEEVSTVRSFAQFEAERAADRGRSRRLTGLRWAAMTGAIAAMLLLAFVIAQSFKPSSDNSGLVVAPESVKPQQLPVAYLSAVQEARWQSPADQPRWRVGDALYAGQRIVLTEGFAELTTRRGAKAILHGPCTVELTRDDNALVLVQGKVVGICETASSRGFSVQTPSARLIDVGTRFGVVHDGKTRTRVIEGVVMAQVTAGDTSTRTTQLVAGQSAVMDEASGQVVSVETLEDRFVTRWASVARAPSIEGAIRYEPAMPTDLRFGRCESDVMQLFPENLGVHLTRDLRVTLTEPGFYDDFREISDQLSAGLTLDSYFVHLDVPGDQAVYREAIIRFDRPVLGVLAASAHLADSHNQFAPTDTVFQSKVKVAEGETDSSGLELSALQSQMRDAIELSEDRKTLTFKLYGGLAIDQVRILVQPETQHEDPSQAGQP